jgi:predicted CXXCH cytochrome family protein
MQGLIALALYAATLVGMLYSSTQSQPWVFAAGTGHQGLECVACHHVHAPTGVRGQWQLPSEEIPHFPFYPYRIEDLNDSSMLCLSCHDGAVAPAVSMGDHPVGVRYDLASPRFASEPGLRTAVEIPLPDGRVQCVSCHDPHGTTGHEDLLRVSNRRSGLCLSCHRM